MNLLNRYFSLKDVFSEIQLNLEYFKNDELRSVKLFFHEDYYKEKEEIETIYYNFEDRYIEETKCLDENNTSINQVYKMHYKDKEKNPVYFYSDDLYMKYQNYEDDHCSGHIFLNSMPEYLDLILEDNNVESVELVLYKNNIIEILFTFFDKSNELSIFFKNNKSQKNGYYVCFELI